MTSCSTLPPIPAWGVRSRWAGWGGRRLGKAGEVVAPQSAGGGEFGPGVMQPSPRLSGSSSHGAGGFGPWVVPLVALAGCEHQWQEGDRSGLGSPNGA